MKSPVLDKKHSYRLPSASARVTHNLQSHCSLGDIIMCYSLARQRGRSCCDFSKCGLIISLSRLLNFTRYICHIAREERNFSLKNRTHISRAYNLKITPPLHAKKHTTQAYNIQSNSQIRLHFISMRALTSSPRAACTGSLLLH